MAIRQSWNLDRKHRGDRLAAIAVALAIGVGSVAPPGCGNSALNPLASTHAKVNWNAEDFFDDPKVVALCEAILADDLDEMDRLIAGGANVSAIGEGNMTPLLWAFPDDRLPCFEKLLQHGADPNVVVSKTLVKNFAVMIGPGDSVTHLACKSRKQGHFDAVFQHGGDPNLVKSTRRHPNYSPLCSVIVGIGTNKGERLQRLLDLGADPDFVCDEKVTPVLLAVLQGMRCDLALVLLENGADPVRVQEGWSLQLTLVDHIARMQGRFLPRMTPTARKSYDALIAWLEDHGESLDAAVSRSEKRHERN